MKKQATAGEEERLKTRTEFHLIDSDHLQGLRRMRNTETPAKQNQVENESSSGMI